MATERRTVIYDGPGGPFEGVAAFDPAAGPRPGVLVIPNILGQKEADNAKAEALVGLGYTALACDLFGQGKRKTRDSENVAEYMNALNADRALLRERLAASLAALAAVPEVDGSRLAAIGFCFGGKAALDIARAGFGVAGVVSFHGLYDPPPFAGPVPIAAKVLVCHGWEDPLARPDSVVALGQELTGKGADWQIHAHGHAGHGFTDRAATGATPGVAYDAAADRRSWRAMADFLAEVLG